MARALEKAGFASADEVRGMMIALDKEGYYITGNEPPRSDGHDAHLRKVGNDYFLNNQPITLKRAIELKSRVDTGYSTRVVANCKLDAEAMRGYKDECPHCGKEIVRKKSGIADSLSITRGVHERAWGDDTLMVYLLKGRGYFGEQGDRVTKDINRAMAYPIYNY